MLRIAIAGAGMVSAHHLRAWFATPDVEVVAIADPEIARAQRRAAEFGVRAVYADAVRMLDAERPDALDIAAGHAAHRPLCLAAAARGIAILCQKPLAPSLDEARTITEEVGAGCRLMVHENWRFRPWYRQTQEWIREGAIGVPLRLQLDTHSCGFLLVNGKRPALDRQPMLASVPHLMIGEVLVHHLDVARWLLGPLSVGSASIKRQFDDVRGETSARIDLVGGATAAGLSGDLAVEGAPLPLTDRMSLVGSRGEITLEQDTLTLWGRECRTIGLDLEGGYQASYDAAIAHFANAMLRDQPFMTAVQDHLAVLALAEDAYRVASRVP
jgi:D-apiose dehydrogenase